MFIDLDTSKNFRFSAMIYYLKRNLAKREYPPRKAIEPILFLGQVFYSVKTCYWPTKLELADIIWVFQKIRHMIESSKHPILVFTNHNVALGIAKQILLSTFFIDKLNLKLI